MAKRGRKILNRHVYRTIEDSIRAMEGAAGSLAPYRVNMLGETRYTLASSSSNAVKITAYDLGAEAKPVSFKDGVEAAHKAAMEDLEAEQKDF